jgi:sterol desaturase/sphingolipid hydroxylase (fatty acid hydroxylase superfamily)
MASDRLFSLFLRRGKTRTNDLGRMSLNELIVAYATYPTMFFYAALFGACVWGSIQLGAVDRPWRTAATIAATLGLYPFYEYVLHRFLLHNRALYKNPLTASVWKRIHYDHHQDPNRLDVLFGHPSNTLLAILGPAIPIGYPINGWSGVLTVAAVDLALFCFYEFCHCVQHLNYVPDIAWLQRIKKHHMAHHFHNETGNFGITLTFVDRLFGTLYEDQKTRPRSPHVYDLGYDEAEARRFPWVAQRSRSVSEQTTVS